jgi:hypothetical protein
MGLLIILGANIVVLYGVYANRNQLPVTSLWLSERELSLPTTRHANKENSAKILTLKWNVAKHEYSHVKTISLSSQALLELGFTPNQLEKKYSNESKELYFSLELDGEVYQQQISFIQSKLEKAKRLESELGDEKTRNEVEKLVRRLENVTNTDSRLYVRDVAADYESLAKKYVRNETSPSKAIIVRGLAELRFNHKDNAYLLRVVNLSVEQIFVPTKIASTLFEGVTDSQYQVKINWGSKLEPWIEAFKVKEGG